MEPIELVGWIMWMLATAMAFATSQMVETLIASVPIHSDQVPVIVGIAVTLSITLVTDV